MVGDEELRDFESISITEEESDQNLLEEYRVSIIFGLLGILSIGLGIFFYKDVLFRSSDDIQVISPTDEGSLTENVIIVEIAGAVKKPGVYELENGSRIDDLIKKSGGLQDNHDKTYIDKIINRAAKLIDGQKIYIPLENEHSNGSSDSNNGRESGSVNDNSQNIIGVSDTQTKRVNINTASQKELEELWGIGPVTAKNIIDQRPYSTVEELLSKKILKSNVFERNKELLTVY